MTSRGVLCRRDPQATAYTKGARRGVRESRVYEKKKKYKIYVCMCS